MLNEGYAPEFELGFNQAIEWDLARQPRRMLNWKIPLGEKRSVTSVVFLQARSVYKKMNSKFVTRQEIIDLLKEWQAGQLTTQQVWNWAGKRFVPGTTEYDDWEGDDSVANEVLCTLDCLDINLVLPEDIPIHLKFLQTPRGQFVEGYKIWEEEIEKIDFKERRRKLKNEPIFGPICS